MGFPLSNSLAEFQSVRQHMPEFGVPSKSLDAYQP